MLMFSIYRGKRAISLHMKDIEPGVRQLYRLRAFFFLKKMGQRDCVRMTEEIG